MRSGSAQLRLRDAASVVDVPRLEAQCLRCRAKFESRFNPPRGNGPSSGSRVAEAETGQLASHDCARAPPGSAAGDNAARRIRKTKNPATPPKTKMIIVKRLTMPQFIPAAMGESD